MIVLVVAIIALRNPQRGATAAGSDTASAVASGSAPPTAPPSGTRGASSGRRSSAASSSAVSGSSASGSTSGSTSSGSTSPPGAGSEPLIVLNDTPTRHLGHQAAARFEAAGWSVTSIDEHYSNDIISTVAYYDPDVSGAKRAATALQRQFPTIKRVVPRFPELPTGPIVVVLTSDYSSS